MSLSITILTTEGIVMATDGVVVRNGETHPRSGHVTKLFRVTNRAALSWTGQGVVASNPIAPCIRSILAEIPEDKPLYEIARDVSSALTKLDGELDGTYTLAGYSEAGAEIFSHGLKGGDIKKINAGDDWRSGVFHTGDGYVLDRLIFPLARRNDDSGEYSDLTHSNVSWNLFNIHDAIDFCLFAIRTTETFLRFLPRTQSVGGAVDIVCITAHGTQWLSTRDLTRWGVQQIAVVNELPSYTEL